MIIGTERPDLAAARDTVVVASFSDITERLTREADLEQSRADLARSLADLTFTQEAMDNSVDGVFWVRAKDGALAYANNAAVRKLEYDRDDLMALTWADIDQHLTVEQVSAVLAEQGPDGFAALDSRHRTRDGRLIEVELNARQGWRDGEPLLIISARGRQRAGRAQPQLRRLDGDHPGLYLHHRRPTALRRRQPGPGAPNRAGIVARPAGQDRRRVVPL